MITRLLNHETTVPAGGSMPPRTRARTRSLSGELGTEYRGTAPRHGLARGFRVPLAFTLVELLVSVTIVVILASMTLFAMSGAQRMAKIQRAKAQVSRIHELLAEKFESFEGRRVPLVGPQPAVNPAQIAVKRLANHRRMLRYDLPDRDNHLDA
ncbi:MAG TPA: type II secretion system protein, partial [Pirellulaceae bacterium]